MMKRAVRLDPRRSGSVERVEETEDAKSSPPVDVERFLAGARRLRDRLPGIHVTDAGLRRMKQEGRP